MADMAGQLMVDAREAGLVKMKEPPPPFLDQPWETAIEEFKRRGIMSDRELSRMLGDYAKRSDTARKLLLDNVQKFVREKIVDALEQGDTYRDFAEKIADGSASLGIVEQDPWYLQTVFRTNVQSAYGAGRYRALTNPDVMEARPFVQYRTVGDARVRDSHASLDGLIFRTDSDEWRRIAPPNGYACRCAIVSLSADEVGDAEIATGLPSGFIPDNDFDGPPVAKL